MSEICAIGRDRAKRVFQVHVVDAFRRFGLQKLLRRTRMVELFGRQPRRIVATESFSSDYFGERELGRLGQDVRLIALSYGKPVLKRQKSDAADGDC